MIEVSNLIKNYAGFKAVQNISFHVSKGEIVGFLGPNGAGKSTTMKILAGYLPPTDGHVTVSGFNVVTESIEVRRRIGYMPENNPLYLDMRVDEFLNYRARVKGVPSRKVKDRVEIVKRQTDIKGKEQAIIGNLSKGYKQRVGLADAMVHEPDLLILDEPTIGLDPNQIRSVRELIKELGKHHTILLSTHILSEVEATCNRVLIINKGRIEASDTPSNLTKRVRGGGALRLELKASPETIASKLRGLTHVEEVELDAQGEWTVATVYAANGEDIRSDVWQVIRQSNWDLREMSRQRATLEDVFVELTHD